MEKLYQTVQKQIFHRNKTTDFQIGMARINDVSMKPAIKDGDLVMYYRLDKRFVSGDIAVFKKDGRTTTGRVVAVAGDTVDITKGRFDD